MKNILITTLVLLCPILAYNQDRWDLEACIKYAHENNIQIKQAEIDSRILEGRLKQSKYELLPDLSVFGSERINYGKTVIPITNELAEVRTRNSQYSASSSIDLFRGFQNVNGIRKNNLDFLASRYDVDRIKNDITLAVTNAYLLILFNLENVEVARQQLDVTSLQIERIDKLVKSGSLAKGNLLELEAQLADEELQFVQSENQVTLSTLNLLQLLQLDGDYDLDIVKPILDSAELAMERQTPSAIFNTSLGLMPEIKSAELKLESSLKNLSIAKASRSPFLSMGASVGTGYSESGPSPYFDQLSENIYRSFGVSLNIPIFSKYSIQQSIDQARLQQERANYSLLLEKQQLRNDVESAYADAEAALKSYDANMKSLVALQVSFEYAQKRFDAGVINSVDYNTNKNNLRRAESQLLRSKYEYIFKRKILDFFQGKEIKL
ncbi:MAG: TolC family protein [Vicingaceae bacterium]